MAADAFSLPPTTRDATPPVDAVRGFVFSSGRSWMQERGLFERYQEHLPPAVRERAFSITALEWVPLDEALACYAACDALELSGDEQREVGRHVSSANNGVLLETIGRLAGGLGVAPWVPLKSLNKVWLRSNRGGAVAVFKEGERTARIELWRVPLVQSPFFRTSMCGAIEAGIALFRDTATVTELRETTSDDTMVLRATW
jgi:hypothetical protein